MPPGPKPQPNALAKLHGSPAHARPANRREPDVAAIEAEAPEWFTKGQRQQWDHIMAHAPRALLRKLDADLLIAWCVQGDLARRAAIDLGQHGAVRTFKDGAEGQWQAYRVHVKSVLIMIRLAEQLGFSPTARRRIFANGWEDLPQGETLKASGEAPSLAEFISNAPGRSRAH